MYLLRHSVYALVDALTGKFVLVDELVFVLYLMSVDDELVLVLVQVLCFVLVQPLVCDPIKQHLQPVKYP